MTNSENNGSSNFAADSHIHEEEINLIDYLVVLWKHKYFVLLATILPTMSIAIVLFLLPGSYNVTYVYDVRSDVISDVISDVKSDIGSWNLNEKNYNLLLSVFYSNENLGRIANNLRKNSLGKYAELLSDKNSQPERFVEFEVVPPFLELSKLNITDPETLDKIREMKASLLNVTITGQSREDMYKISSVIRDNIEKVIPLYMIQDQLSSYVRRYNSGLADIESGRFNLELALNNNNSILAALKTINVGVAGNGQSSVILQFDIGSNSQYLPLDYQIQAAESKKVDLERDIKADEEKYKYYKDLLDFNNRILAELSSKLSSDNTDYTIGQFKLFLINSIDSYEKQELKDCLNSYIKKIENRIAISTPVVENPRIYTVSKGTVKKSAIVFAIALMLSVFTAFLLEGLGKSQAQAP